MIDFTGFWWYYVHVLRGERSGATIPVPRVGYHVNGDIRPDLYFKEGLLMYVIMTLVNGREAIRPLDGERREAIMAYAGRGFSNLFLRGFTLTNAL